AAPVELADEVEVADGHELHALAGDGQPRRHVPGGDAQGRGLGPGERKVAEMDAAQQREPAQTLGLTTDLGDESDGLAATRGKEHAHAGPEPADRSVHGGPGVGARHGWQGELSDVRRRSNSSAPGYTRWRDRMTP